MRGYTGDKAGLLMRFETVDLDNTQMVKDLAAYIGTLQRWESAVGTKLPLTSEFWTTASEKSQPNIVGKFQSSKIHTPLPGNFR